MSLVSESVPGLLGWGAVVVEPVGLDDQAQIWLEEVDGEPVQLFPCARRRKTGSPHEAQKSALQLGIGELERVAIKGFAERCNSVSSAVLVYRRAEGFGVDQPKLVRLVDRRLERLAAKSRRQVDQGPSRRGHRDAVATRHVPRDLETAAMKADLLATPADIDGHREVDWTNRALRSDSPERRRARMTEDCCGPAAKDGRHPPAVLGEMRPANRIDTSPEAMKAAACETTINLVGTETRT